MTRIVLCYGVILGLYCLLHGVYGSEDDPAAKHAKHNRRRGDGYSESGIPKDKIFIKSESPLRGRKIHQTAWSEEEATENMSPDEFKMTEKTTDSWNFEKLYSYLLSLIHKTEEMEQAEMTPSETVEMIRNKIKSEIKARKKTESGKIGSEVPKSSESRRLTYEKDFETSNLDGLVENSESSEESEESDEYDESCEEDDSSSEIYDDRKNIKHKDKKENGSENKEDCYENEESDENSSVKKETGSANAKKHETISAKERTQSTSINTPLPGQEITVLNGKSVKDNQKPINIQGKPTGAARIGSKPQMTGATPNSKNTVRMNKDGNVESSTDIGITPTTSSNAHESTVVNPLPTNSGVEKSTDQFIRSNTTTESNAHETPTISASTLNENSVRILQKESSNTGGIATTTMKGLNTDSKSASQTLPQDNFEGIIKAPEFIPISNKEIGNIEVPSNKVTDVKPNMDEMLNVPVEVAHVYGGHKSKPQKVDVSENEVPSQINLQNQVAKETKSEPLLDTSGKTSKGDSVVFTQENYENMENNHFQQESFNYGKKDDILEEYNLKNEFIELSDNNKNEFMNMLKDYNTNNQKHDDAFQHSSVSQNVEFNEENANQETFDTILEFLYKHSKNPLILSLRNSNKTLF